MATMRRSMTDVPQFRQFDFCIAAQPKGGLREGAIYQFGKRQIIVIAIFNSMLAVVMLKCLYNRNLN